jgi:hypothetical protein
VIGERVLDILFIEAVANLVTLTGFAVALTEANAAGRNHETNRVDVAIAASNGKVRFSTLRTLTRGRTDFAFA